MIYVHIYTHTHTITLHKVPYSEIYFNLSQSRLSTTHVVSSTLSIVHLREESWHLKIALCKHDFRLSTILFARVSAYFYAIQFLSRMRMYQKKRFGGVELTSCLNMVNYKHSILCSNNKQKKVSSFYPSFSYVNGCFLFRT